MIARSCQLGLEDLLLRDHLVQVELRAVLREQLTGSIEVFAGGGEVAASIRHFGEAVVAEARLNRTTFSLTPVRWQYPMRPALAAFLTS